ncbi:MAG: hypothetical protein LBH06_00665 [Rikenellaceae bacterium]|jgi:hypothetical protein|nr:hypothetical protein [Rikenellaceae bacterium]
MCSAGVQYVAVLTDGLRYENVLVAVDCQSTAYGKWRSGKRERFPSFRTDAGIANV